MSVVSTIHPVGTNQASSSLGASHAPEVVRVLEGLQSEASQHEAVDHPYLQALAAGTLDDPRGALQDFARAYSGYSAWFPRFLAALGSRLPKALSGVLDANREEERGHYSEPTLCELESAGLHREWVEGIPHPELFRRFQESLGVDPHSQVVRDSPVARWREGVLRILLGDHPAAAVGAIGFGTEFVVARMYARVLEAVDRFGGIGPEGRSFLVLHSLIDDGHSASLLELAARFAGDEEGRQALARGMRGALDLRAAFWAELHAAAKSA
jgi:pyrroloquinoline quinone (PQQ) biosynthesis protein C